MQAIVGRGFLETLRLKHIVAFHFFLVFLVLLTICFAKPVFADSRHLEIREVIIEAGILADGSMDVIERRSYYFGGGTFYGAHQDFDFFGGISYHNVKVAEEGVTYEYVEEFPTERPGTYSVKAYDDHFTLDYSFEAHNELKTFIISYNVADVVLSHNDIAELNHKFIGDRWDYGTGYAKVSLTLPSGASDGELLAWGYGSLHGKVQVIDTETVTWEASNLDANSYLEGRVLFPLQLVPEATNFTGKNAKNSIILRQKIWAALTNAERLLYAYEWFTPLALLLLILLYVFAVTKRTRKIKNTFPGDYYRELPGDYSPAETGYLLRQGKTESKDFTATIMDLARRKYISIEEVPVSGGRQNSDETDFRLKRLEKKKGLTPHEERVLGFLFDLVAYENRKSGNNFLCFSDITKFAKDNKVNTSAFMGSWKNDIEKQVIERGFFTDGMNGLQKLGILLAVVFFVGGLFTVSLTDLNVAGFSLMGGAIILFLAMILMKLTYSVEGGEQASKWQAFKRFLLHFSDMDKSTIPSLVIWEHYLVYAAALGITKEVLRQLELVFPHIDDEPTEMGLNWKNLRMENKAGFMGGFEKIDSSLSAAANSRAKSDTTGSSSDSSSYSSGSGTGGGFSRGGGSGSGGGGGGFR